MTVTDQDRDGLWKEWRRAGVTATDIAQASTGIYGTIRTVVEDKLDPPDDEPTPAMLRGHAAEEPITRAVEALTGLHAVNAQLWAEHSERPEWRATIDGELATAPDAEPVAVLELKTRNQRVAVPRLYYLCQVQWQLLVRGRPLALVARGDYTDLDDGTETLVGLRLDRIDADADLQAQLVEVADRIISYVAAGTLPPVDGSELVAERIARRYEIADRDADAVPLDDLADLLAARVDVLAELERVETEKRRIESTIKDRLGEATRGVTAAGWRASWPARRTLDLAALRAAGHGDLIDRHTRREPKVDLTALAADLGKKTADQFRTVPAGRGGLTITPPKETP